MTILDGFAHRRSAVAIKTCLFDLGNVLVFFSHEKMCQQIGELVGRTQQEVQSALLDSRLQLEFESGKLTAAETHQRLDELFGSKTKLADFEHAASAIFELNEPMVPLLDEVKAAGVRLVLLSNTCSSHFEYVKQTYDLLSRFDDFTLSYQAGATKPSPIIYKDALSRANCEPAECFYTDDIGDYIYAAQEFGIDAEQFQNAAATREQLVARGALS